MKTQITKANKTSSASYVQMTCNSVSALVSVYSYGIQVCCQNSAHKVWRGSGKFFPTIETALANYKSQEMQEMIKAAVQFNGLSIAQ